MATKPPGRVAAARRATAGPRSSPGTGRRRGRGGPESPLTRPSALAGEPPPSVPPPSALPVRAAADPAAPAADAAPLPIHLPSEPPRAPPGAGRTLPLSAAAALRLLLGTGTDALRADLPPALAGDAEAVHRMRTTLRRTRAVLRLFRPLLPAAAGAHDRALRRIGRALSAARDWDVFLDETLPRAAADGVPAAALAALRRAGETRQRAAYASLRRRLGGPAVAEVTGSLLAWAAELEPPTPALARSLAALGPRLSGRLVRQVRRRGRNLAGASPAALHALRKSVRRLRDATDSLIPLGGRRQGAGSLRACRKLADRLGRLNDATVAAALAARLAGPRGAGPAAAAALSDWADRAGRRALPRVGKAWKALRRSGPFRKH